MYKSDYWLCMYSFKDIFHFTLIRFRSLAGKMGAKSTYLFLLLPYLKPDLFQMWAVTKFSSERISDVIFVSSQKCIWGYRVFLLKIGCSIDKVHFWHLKHILACCLNCTDTVLIPFTLDNFHMDYPVIAKLHIHWLKAVQVVWSLHTVLKV